VANGRVEVHQWHSSPPWLTTMLLLSDARKPKLKSQTLDARRIARELPDGRVLAYWLNHFLATDVMAMERSGVVWHKA